MRVNVSIREGEQRIRVQMSENTGTGGTRDYRRLTNLPQINSVELLGNKSAAELGLVPAADYAPTEKTAAMTQPVGRDGDGKLWTTPGGSGGGDVTRADYLALFPTDTASGDPARFPDGGDGLPIPALTVSLEPVQSGSGDPDAENPRPFVLYDRVTLVQAASKAFDFSAATALAHRQPGTGTPNAANLRPIAPALSFLRDDDSPLTVYRGSLTVNTDGTATLTSTHAMQSITSASARYATRTNRQGTFQVGYTTSVDAGNTISSHAIWSNALTASTAGGAWNLQVPATVSTEVWNGPNRIFVAPPSGITALDAYLTWLDAIGTLQVLYPRASALTYTLSVAETERALTSLTGAARLYPIALGREIVGGTLTLYEDNTAALSVRPYYPSYSGEALTGPWLSSLDVYSEGTAPTIGAEVLDLGGAPALYPLTGPELTTFCGENVFWTNAGGVTLTYRADMQRYAERLAGHPLDLGTVTSLELHNGYSYTLEGITALDIAYPEAEHWSSWLRLTTASSGTVSITLPQSRYIGSAPNFANGETWELSIKDGVVTAGQVT